MRLTPQNTDKIKKFVLACIGVVIVISISAAIYAGQQAALRIRNDLRKNSEIAAAAVDIHRVTNLKGDSSDETSPDYVELKRVLGNVAKSDPEIRSIYVTGNRDGRLFFYVDSEDPSSPDYSPAGEYYDDATEEFKGVFTTKQTVVEGPVSDDFGTFISGLAPMFDPSNGKVVAVLGIDVASSTYWRDIAVAAIIPLSTGLTLILILLFFELIRRRNAQLMALRSELVSVASHEIRNPLTGIRWAASSLEPYAKEETAKRLAHSIVTSAERLQASTDDILELSHAMNRRKLQLKPTDINSILREIADVQSLTAQQKGVQLATDQSWPNQLTITCDETMVKRVLYNIVSNAIKYTKENTSVVFSYSQQNNTQSIYIRDQGIGIPKAEQSKVYKGFYRASNAVASDIPGTGLGLYLVKIVMEQHGGSVRFESEENVGTTIILTFPLK